MCNRHCGSGNPARKIGSCVMKAFGDIVKVQVPGRRAFWQGGSAYNYGIGEAHYPVPAICPEPLTWHKQNVHGIWGEYVWDTQAGIVLVFV